MYPRMRYRLPGTTAKMFSLLLHPAPEVTVPLMDRLPSSRCPEVSRVCSTSASPPSRPVQGYHLPVLPSSSGSWSTSRSSFPPGPYSVTLMLSKWAVPSMPPPTTICGEAAVASGASTVTMPLSYSCQPDVPTGRNGVPMRVPSSSRGAVVETRRSGSG